jgi:hypothetical protein
VPRLTDEQARELIARHLGREDDEAFASLILDTWLLWEPATPGNQLLLFHLVKLEAIHGAARDLDRAFDWKEGDSSESRSGLLKQMLAQVEGIEQTIAHLKTSRFGVAVGQIARKAPIERRDRPAWPPEPHDRRYLGDPLVRSPKS